jgi:phage tail-like protein
MIAGLASPAPLAHRLPGVLQDDEFTQRFLGAFDDAYAPIITTLDSLACYFDPHLAPPDFVDFLAGWVGIALDDSWSVEQRRAIVAGAALVHRRRGTRRGIEEALGLGLGAEVTVTDTGGCTWSQTPGGDLPGTGPARMELRIEVADPDHVDPRRVESLIEATKPAHVAHSFTVATTASPRHAADPPRRAS